jgi:hypothetical protein
VKSCRALGFFEYLRSCILTLTHISYTTLHYTSTMTICYFCQQDCQGTMVHCCGIPAHMHCRNRHLASGSRVCPVCFTSWVGFIPDLTPPASPEPGGSGACNYTDECCIVCLEPCSQDDKLQCCPQYMHLRCIFNTIFLTECKKCPNCRKCWRHYMNQSMDFEVSTNL